MASVAIVPAAGKGERFGGAKLVARIQGEVLLDRTLRSLLDAGIERVVVVVAPGLDLTAAQLLADGRVQTVVNEDPSRGMFSSIQTGMSVAGGDPVLILPADMPFVRTHTVARVTLACLRRRTVVVPIHAGRRGHPVAFPAALHQAVLHAPPDSTLKDALAETGAERVELQVDDPGILRDVDVRADLSD